MGPSWADDTFRRRDIFALSLGQMTGGAHATMQDAHNNHFFNCHAVENHMRALRNAAIPPSDIGATPPRLGEIAQLAEPAMQIVDISNHLGVAPLFERVGCN